MEELIKLVQTEFNIDTFSLITESVLLFSIIPLFYLIFYFFISENINSPEYNNLTGLFITTLSAGTINIFLIFIHFHF